MAADDSVPEPEFSSTAQSPPWLYRILEARAPVEYAAMALAGPLLGRERGGDGHPVLVLPGFTADDRSTFPLRRILMKQGYRAYGWRLGANIGPTPEIVDGLTERFVDIHERSGKKVSLIGWSLGGVYARQIARQYPEGVRQVITLGSPFRMIDTDQSTASRLFDSLRHLFDTDRPHDLSVHEHDRVPLSVPATAIYTRTDGVVRWQKCIETDGPLRESIEVVGSHIGLGFNPAVVMAVTNRLRQPEGQWRRFQPSLAQRALFPLPVHFLEPAA